MHTAEIAHMREARRDRGLCLAAWWQKVERDERNFFRKVENEEKSSMEEKIKSNKKKNDQEKFISKFFPACNSSPGGTLRQVKLEAKVALLVKSEDKIASIIMGQRNAVYLCECGATEGHLQGGTTYQIRSRRHFTR